MSNCKSPGGGNIYPPSAAQVNEVIKVGMARKAAGALLAGKGVMPETFNMASAEATNVGFVYIGAPSRRATAILTVSESRGKPRLYTAGYCL